MVVLELMSHISLRRRVRTGVKEATACALADDCWLIQDTLLVPAECCLLTMVEVPARRRQDIQAALPFVLEERLAQDLTEIRYAWQRQGEGIAVLVCDRAQLQRWRQNLPDGIAAASLQVLPDVLALPLEADQWSLFLKGQRLLVRTGLASGFAYELDEAPTLLAILAGQSPPARGLLLLYEQGEDGVTDELHGLITGLGLVGQERGFVWPRNSPGTVPKLRLVEDPKPLSPGRHLWLLALVLLCSGAALQAGVMVWSTARMAHRQQDLQRRAVTLFREAFPDIKRVVNPRVQARQHLAALQVQAGGRNSGTGLLPMMLTIGKSLQTQSAMHLLRFRYHDGSLEIDIEAPGVSVIDGLRSALNASGLQAELLSARLPGQGGQSAQASLEVRAP